MPTRTQPASLAIAATVAQAYLAILANHQRDGFVAERVLRITMSVARELRACRCDPCLVARLRQIGARLIARENVPPIAVGVEVTHPEEHTAKCKAAALIKQWIRDHETAPNDGAFTRIDVPPDKLVERLATDTDAHEAVTRARAIDLTALQVVSLRQAIFCLHADDHTAAVHEIENMLAAHFSEKASADTE